MYSEGDAALVLVLFLAEDEGLASANCITSTSLANSALNFEGNLLGGLCLLTENWFCLTPKSFLFGTVTTLTLSKL
jgi:hypothetical protein